MGEHKNLSDRDAIAKIKDIAKDQIAMLCTFTSDGRLHARPMATQGIDDDGTIWMFSGKSSLKNVEIEDNANVQLFYSLPNKSEYLTLEGIATITRDRAKIDELWNQWAKAWFTEGKDDPDLTLIAIRPTSGNYWDTKHNKMVQLAKIAVGAVLGKTMDDGVMGRLDVDEVTPTEPRGR